MFSLFSVTVRFVKMQFNSITYKTRMIESNNPYWNKRFNLGKVSVRSSHLKARYHMCGLIYCVIVLIKVDTHQSLHFELWDEDLQYDDRLGACYTDPTQGTHTITCSTLNGGFEIRYTLTCDKHLTGDYCNRYKPSPV